MRQSKSSRRAKLLYGSSDTSPDSYYLAGFYVPDPFLLIVDSKRRIGVLSRLEIDRAATESSLTKLISLEEAHKSAREAFAVEKAETHHIVQLIAGGFGIQAFDIPASFPAGIALKLIEAGLDVKVVEGTFLPERIQKSEVEVSQIRKANKASAAGIRAAERALKASAIKNGKLVLDGKALTSERLRCIIDTACLEQGAVATRTICAGGDQACDPHCIGSGPLRANELIIVDVFPRLNASGYHGDMTRTFLKGRATPEQRRLIQTVRLAQYAAIEKVKAGVKAPSIHAEVTRVFDDSGYETGQVNGVWQGFFHGTGHGLGLEVHEQPRVSHLSDARMKSGMVVTIEPGLYYPGVGGARIEDVVCVTPDGCELVSSYPYKWELK